MEPTDARSRGRTHHPPHTHCFMKCSIFYICNTWAHLTCGAVRGRGSTVIPHKPLLIDRCPFPKNAKQITPSHHKMVAQKLRGGCWLEGTYRCWADQCNSRVMPYGYKRQGHENRMLASSSHRERKLHARISWGECHYAPTQTYGFPISWNMCAILLLP